MSSAHPISVSPQAEQNNKKLFKKFAKVFTNNNPGVFAAHAEKLAAWLKDSKAYYPAARPEIVKLLLIAQITVQKTLERQPHAPQFHVSQYPNHPMVGPYANLILSIAPFERMFVESSLQAHIKQLLSTVMPGYLNGSSSSVLQQAQNCFLDSNMASCSNHPPQSVQLATSNALPFDDPDVQIIENPNPTPRGQQGSPPPAVVSPQYAILPRTVKVKVKKKKAINFELLVQRDISSLSQREGTGAAKDHIHIPKVQTESPGLSKQPTSANLVHTPATRVDPAVSTPSVAQFENTQSVVISGPRIAAGNLGSPHVQESKKNSREPQPIVQGEATTTVPSTWEMPQPPSDLCVLTEVSPYSTTNAVKGSASTPLARNSLFETVFQQPIDTGDLPVVVNVDGGRSPLEPLVIPDRSMDLELTTMPNAVSSPPATGRPRALSTLQDEGGNVGENFMTGIFGNDLRIVVKQRGLQENSQILVDFHIPASQYNLVSQWINRNNPSLDIRESLCITLGCYSAADLCERGIGEETFDRAISTTPSLWPTHGLLTMNVKYDDCREDVPLSPPFEVTPDNLVDVSGFLCVGRNVIQLNQRQDSSHHVFVLHAHHPTRAQIKQMQERLRKDREWHEWLDHVCRPLEVPLDIL